MGEPTSNLAESWGPQKGGILHWKWHFCTENAVFTLKKPIFTLKMPFLHWKSPFLHWKCNFYTEKVHFYTEKAHFYTEKAIFTLQMPFSPLKMPFSTKNAIFPLQTPFPPLKTLFFQLDWPPAPPLELFAPPNSIDFRKCCGGASRTTRGRRRGTSGDPLPQALV